MREKLITFSLLRTRGKLIIVNVRSEIIGGRIIQILAVRWDFDSSVSKIDINFRAKKSGKGSPEWILLAEKSGYP